MISDEPDEDADNLDDETLLRAYLGVGAATQAATDSTTDLPDWPQRRERDPGLNIDPETLAWFKARHGDWRGRMASVLRAWVAAHTLRENSVPVGSAILATSGIHPAPDSNASL
ncbi:hypothetical protein [Rhodopila sp.]|uniref:hypothetical protein n=1 Tax=Rhodopila sp. TaxID=2480087 RepID=UPI003D0DDA50